LKKKLKIQGKTEEQKE